MKGFARYYGKKLIWYFVTLIIAVILNFLLPRLMPGNPVDMLVNEALTGAVDPGVREQMVQQYTKDFGLDKSLPEQFIVYVGNLFQGNMGMSISQYPRTVNDIIGSSIVWTLGLQIPAIIVGWILGNALGAIAAYIRRGFDKFILPFFMFISNFPAFGLAMIFVWIFASQLKWFPVGGGYDSAMMPSFSFAFVASVLEHYQLPFWTMVLITIGGQAIGMRSMSIYELNADYVKYSRFMGIKDGKIVKYVFRNAMLPQVTGLALSLGTMVGGNLIAEMVFSYPGIGMVLFKAISGRDYPLLSGCTLIITLMVLVTTLAVELLYGVIDPRIKASQMDE